MGKYAIDVFSESVVCCYGLNVSFQNSSVATVRVPGNMTFQTAKSLFIHLWK